MECCETISTILLVDPSLKTLSGYLTRVSQVEKGLQTLKAVIEGALMDQSLAIRINYVS